MRETWYVLEDGTVADPNEVAPDDKGILRHAGGLAVAMRDAAFPMSRGVDDPDGLRVQAKEAADAAMKKAEAEAAKAKDDAEKADKAKAAKESKPDDAGGYKTRESKAG